MAPWTASVSIDDATASPASTSLPRNHSPSTERKLITQKALADGHWRCLENSMLELMSPRRGSNDEKKAPPFKAGPIQRGSLSSTLRVRDKSRTQVSSLAEQAGQRRHYAERRRRAMAKPPRASRASEPGSGTPLAASASAKEALICHWAPRRSRSSRSTVPTGR